MAQLIAKNTIQRVLDGKFVSHAPDTRFEMLDADAEHLVRMRAAVYANPRDVVPVQALVEIQATDAPAVTEIAPEPAPVEPETPTEADADADAKPKRTRKTKTEVTE